MEIIWSIYPADRETYLRILTDLTPILDREGFSFRILRPMQGTPRKVRVKEVKK